MSLAGSALLGAIGLMLWPFPASNVFLNAMAHQRPVVYNVLTYSYATLWFTTPFFALSVERLAALHLRRAVGSTRCGPTAPPYPLPATRPDLFLVLGEHHHQTTPGRAPVPRWLGVLGADPTDTGRTVPISTVARGPHANLHFGHTLDGFCRGPAQLEPWLPTTWASSHLRSMGFRRTVALNAVISTLQESIHELSPKLEQKTAHELGDVPEIDLQWALCEAFHGDNIRRVKKGESGADRIHEVCTTASTARRSSTTRKTGGSFKPGSCFSGVMSVRYAVLSPSRRRV